MAEETKSKMEQELEAEINSVEYFIEKSPKTGDYTLALKKEGKKQYILSKYKPREHAIEQLGEDWGNKSTVWILIGYGFGYMTEAILDKVGNDTRIIIIEPNQELLQEQMKLSPVREEAINTYILYTLNAVQLQKILQSLIPETEMYNINIRYFNKYLEYYYLFCNLIFKEIANLKSTMEINFYTNISKKRDNNLNCLKNASYISENHDIYHLRKLCKDIPALIVCAGPSLEKNIDEIKNFKGIIIAIGRTLTPLIKRGIRPDFVINIDPTDLIYETFGEFKENDIPLLTLMDANAKVVFHNKGKKYLMYNDPIVTTIFKAYVNPTLDVYLSVSSLCLSFTEFLGCNPIMVVGQDLAWTDNKIHSGDKKIEGNIQDPFLKIIKGFDGQLIKSSETWATLIKWIELQVQKYPNITHINATEGGAYIEGMTHMSLKEAIQKYCIKEKPEITHVKLQQEKEINYKKCMQEAKNSLNKIQRLSKNLEACYKQLELEYAKDKQKSWSKIQQIFKNIKQIEKSIEHVSNSKNLIDLLLEKVKMTLETDNDNKEQIDELEWEENVRIMRCLKERYYYLAKECEDFIMLIDIALDDYQRSNKK